LNEFISVLRREKIMNENRLLLRQYRELYITFEKSYKEMNMVKIARKNKKD